MKASTKNLIWGSALTLVAMPFLYVGGQSNNTALIGLGFICFCVGMAVAPIQRIAKGVGAKSQADKSVAK